MGERRMIEQWEINNIYVCSICGNKVEYPSDYTAPECCGQEMGKCGESIPAE